MNCMLLLTIEVSVVMRNPFHVFSLNLITQSSPQNGLVPVSRTQGQGYNSFHSQLLAGLSLRHCSGNELQLLQPLHLRN